MLTVIADDLDVLLDDPSHRGRLVGTVEATCSRRSLLTVRRRRFRPLRRRSDDPKARRMTYRMELASRSGDTFFFDGYKLIRDDPLIDQWADTTTLFVTVRRDGESGPVAGRGILRIRPQDFMSR